MKKTRIDVRVLHFETKEKFETIEPTPSGVITPQEYSIALSITLVLPLALPVCC